MNQFARLEGDRGVGLVYISPGRVYFGSETGVGNHLLDVVLAASASLSFASNSALAIPAWELNTVTGFRNSSWAFGERFMVTAEQDLTINALGVLDVG